MNIHLATSVIVVAVSYICFLNHSSLKLFFISYYSYIHALLYGLSSQNLSSVKVENEKLFTEAELVNYKGKDGKLYLSILGHVFDVSKGKKYYGPGKSYHGFAGRDASRAFITGDFTAEGLVDDLTDLTLSDLSSLRDWLDRYQKDYTYKGKLIGRFYDALGNPTPYLNEIKLKLIDADEKAKQDEDYNIKYPPCNIEWSQEKGSRVWCSKKSGGVKRDWVGVPRKLFLPGWSDYRCACIKPNSDDMVDKGKLKHYETCNPYSESCYVGSN